MDEARRRDRRRAAAVCGLLLLMVAIVFGRTAGYDFVNFDDDAYVYDNPHVSHGLSGESVAWSFTAFHSCNWHPLTWLSHALDCQLYGTQHPGLHHLTNIVLHAAVAIAPFLVLWRMSGELWPSGFVAAVFAVHPLRVESVAWISERKDLLSGLFLVLTLAAYLRYVRRPFSWGRYLLVIAMFCLGLLAKPMLVTLPFLLLLLDYWPLGRLVRGGGADIPVCRSRPAAPGRQECLPHRPISMLSLRSSPCCCWRPALCLITSAAQQKAAGAGRCRAHARADRQRPGLLRRLSRPVLLSRGTGGIHPHPQDSLPLWKIVAAATILIGVSIAAVLGRRRLPYLFVGWFWYVGMLVPVIGVVQVGSQAMADRYTYLPQIGLCIALAWALPRQRGSFCLPGRQVRVRQSGTSMSLSSRCRC